MKLERERMYFELKMKGEFVPKARSEIDDNQNDDEEVARSEASGHTSLKLSAKKVKFSHTRYRALGPELIPVYRQSARR